MRRRLGLRRQPEGGWPLDEIFVGVATLRTTRELFRRTLQDRDDRWRAWDLYLRVDASLQGCRYATERLEKAGLLELAPSKQHWHASSYRLDPAYPLLEPLRQLFSAERHLVRGTR